MENISNDKILYYPERVAGDFRPITADIFLTNYCNNKCGYCTYGRWDLNHQKKYVTFDEFKQYANILINMGVRGFILTGGGEPTINKDFDKITAWLEENGLHYGINTNFNILKYFKPDYLKVSLDGHDAESYKSIRGVDSYNTVKENIIKYYDWKVKNSPSTNLGVQFVVANHEDVLRFYEGNKDLPFDYMSLRPMESRCGSYYKNQDNFDEAQRCREEIMKIAKIDSRVMPNYKWNTLTDFYPNCPAHWSQIALDENGNVIYCCHKPFEVMGHITDENVLENYALAKCNNDTCDAPCRLTAPNYWIDKLNKERESKNFI